MKNGLDLSRPHCGVEENVVLWTRPSHNKRKGPLNWRTGGLFKFMLVSWMWNMIDADLQSTISYMEKAKDLWEDIQEHLSVANRPCIQQIKTQLNDHKQCVMSMVAYYGKMKVL